ncbi:GNAT family N-acetyltransferase [Actinocorallia longicatena]|uniref:GNAT family N-acetyltransferase n=1 Tax=Actinocorallia longicatena TaxID=111803 RepID=A0ABP6QKM0_9ACTN
MTPTFRIFQATPSDAPAIGEVHAESWKAAYASFFTDPFFTEAVESRRTKWTKTLAEAPPGTIALLAALDDRPLAFSYSGPSHTRPGEAEIYGFYAHPAAWGTGIAPALMTATLHALHTQGHPRAHLWTLRDTPQSRRFYEKSGFTPTPTPRTHDYGNGTPVPQIEYTRPLP